VLAAGSSWCVRVREGGRGYEGGGEEERVGGCLLVLEEERESERDIVCGWVCVFL